jgi:serine phosphatase RsbU (regulator of sigma subunit)
MYTDGIIETEDSNRRQLGINGLINFFKQSIYLSVDENVETILAGVQEFSQQPIKDDVYVLLAGMK